MNEQPLASALLDALNSHDPAAISALLAPDFVYDEMRGAGQTGAEAVLAEFALVFAALPDITFRLVRISGLEDGFHLEFRALGTHQGEFLGVLPTNTLALFGGVMTIRGGEQIEHLRMTIDFGGLRRQLLTAARQRAERRNA